MVYYIQDNNLKFFYLKDKKNFIENKENNMLKALNHLAKLIILVIYNYI